MYADKYTPYEGADWFPIPDYIRVTKSQLDVWNREDWGRFNYLGAGNHDATRMHSIHFPDDSVWDCINGWRDQVRSFQILPESDPNGLDVSAPGSKLDAGKIDVTAFAFQYFPRALMAVAEVGQRATERKGYPWKGWAAVDNGVRRYAAALGRHELAVGKYGNASTDPQLDVLHIAQVAWNALARLELFLAEEEKKSLKA